MSGCGNDRDFIDRILFFGEKEVGRILHDPATNEIRSVNGSAINLSQLIGSSVTIKYG